MNAFILGGRGNTSIVQKGILCKVRVSVFERMGDTLPDKERGWTKNDKKQTSNSREVICQKSLAR